MTVRLSPPPQSWALRLGREHVIVWLGRGLSAGPTASVFSGVGCMAGHQGGTRVCVRVYESSRISVGGLGYWGLHRHGKHPVREYIRNNKFTNVTFVYSRYNKQKSSVVCFLE